MVDTAFCVVDFSIHLGGWEVVDWVDFEAGDGADGALLMGKI